MKTAFATAPAPSSFSPVLFAGEGATAVRVARELGFDAIDLSIRDPQDTLVIACVEAAAAAHLSIRAIGTGQSFQADGLSFSSVDERVRADAKERFTRIIHLAARFGGLIIVGGMRGRLPAESSQRDEQYSRTIETLRSLARDAARYGVRLAIEPLNRYETNFLNTISETLAALADIAEDNVGVVADTFHMNIEEASLSDALRAAGDRLTHVQFVDSNRRVPGQGHIDFNDLARTLCDLHYTDYVSAEVLPLPDSRRAAAEWLAYFRQLSIST